MMPCNKVRAFGFLILMCCLHVIFCCIYFKFKNASFLAEETNIRKPDDALNRRSFKLTNGSLRIANRKAVVDFPNPSTNREKPSADVVTRAEDVTKPNGDVTPCPGAVKPRAKVTAPWKRVREDNTTVLCPLVPPYLVGPLATYREAPNFTEIVRQNPGLEPGGHYQPAECRARHRVAIIISYRDREEHLRVLLYNLHSMLRRQQLDYFILVVELAMPTHFNRGLLLNVGAVEAMGLWDVHCVIFHDVDLIPENDLNLYTCPDQPRHMSAAVDKFRYKLPFKNIFGGVTAMRTDQFCKMNGFSNLYFGWGGEDDDLYKRVVASGLNVTRHPMKVARYWMFRHKTDKGNEPNNMRFRLLNKWKNRWTHDGLNSLKYEVEKAEFRPGYTWMLVTVDEKQYSQVVERKRTTGVQPPNSRRVTNGTNLKILQSALFGRAHTDGG